MVQQLTQGIKISVQTEYQGAFIKTGRLQYAFAYTVTIENQGKNAVQLTSRFWEIKDSLNDPIIVEGEGVIGRKPIILPGEQHTYESGCILSSPYGCMQGHYNLVNFTTARNFKVPIPLFNLSAVFALN